MQIVQTIRGSRETGYAYGTGKRGMAGNSGGYLLEGNGSGLKRLQTKRDGEECMDG